MSAVASLEKRLAAVEAAVKDLQAQAAPRAPAPNWLERLTGSLKDEPAFREVLEFGRAHRQADRPVEDETS